MISGLFRLLSICFFAGALGGLASAVTMAFFESAGIHAFFNYPHFVSLSPEFIQGKIVWGGVWGFVFMIALQLRALPLNAWLLSGLLFSFAPWFTDILVLIPYVRDVLPFITVPAGGYSMEQSASIAFLDFIYNAVWGLMASFLVHTARQA